MHISENVGVTGVVYFYAILELDHVPAAFAAIDDLTVIFNAAGMVGMDHGHINIPTLLRTTFIHRHDLFGALLVHPQAKLIDTNNFGIMLFGQRHGVTNVITMSMGAKHDVKVLNFFV